MAPVYMFCWHIFSNAQSGMFTAVLSILYSIFFNIVPLAFTIVFWVIGEGFIKFDLISDSMSRSGVVSELSKGPVHYGICICLASIFFWKRVEAFYCILPISFGDGLSAFFGPSVKGNRPLWWNPSKTWFGLIAFCIASYFSLVLHLWYYGKYYCIDKIMNRNGWLINSDPNYMVNALYVSIFCALTESFTIKDYDNFTIFAMGILSYNYVKWNVCCNKQ